MGAESDHLCEDERGVAVIDVGMKRLLIRGLLYRLHNIIAHSIIIVAITGKWHIALGTSIAVNVLNVVLYYHFHFLGRKIGEEMGRIIWFTGQSGAGKTTVAREIHKQWDCILLDGDEMRDSISLGAGFSREDRREHNLRVASIEDISATKIRRGEL